MSKWTRKRSSVASIRVAHRLDPAACERVEVVGGPPLRRELLGELGDVVALVAALRRLVPVMRAAIEAAKRGT